MAVTVVPITASEAFAEEWQYNPRVPNADFDEIEEVMLYSYDDYEEHEMKYVYGDWQDTPPATGEYETMKVYQAWASVCPCHSWFWMNSGGKHSDCKVGPFDGYDGDVPYNMTSQGLYVYSSNDMATFEKVDDEDASTHWCAELPRVISKENPGEFGEIYLIMLNGESVDEFVSNSPRNVIYLWRKKKATSDGSRATSKNKPIYRSVEVVLDEENHDPNWSEWSEEKPDEADNRVIREVSGYKFRNQEDVDLALPQRVSMYLGDTLDIDGAQDDARTYTSSSSRVATVSSDGLVSAKALGSAQITVRTAAGNGYKAGLAKVKVTTSLKPPELTATQDGARSIKLSWTKSPCASGYQIYRAKVASNGTTGKFVRVATKSYKVSGTTNTRLSKKATYKYKVRSYKKVKGKRKYSAFSEVQSVTLQ